MIRNDRAMRRAAAGTAKIQLHVQEKSENAA
jgi:hypothetical protein